MPETKGKDGLMDATKQLCYAGLTLDELPGRIMTALRSIVPFDAHCFNQVDPATELMMRSLAEGVGGPAAARLFLEELYFEEYLPELKRLARSRCPVGLLSEHWRGQMEQSEHFNRLLRPLHFGDELRLVCTAGGRFWAFIVLYRETGAPRFSPEERQALALLGPHIGAALQAAVLQTIAREPEAPGAAPAPGVLVLDQQGRVEHFSEAGMHWLGEIGQLGPDWMQGEQLPVPVVQTLSALGRMLSAADGDGAPLPLVSVYGRSGRWLSISASHLAPGIGEGRKRMVMLEPAVPRELLKLHTGAFSLTPAEEAVVKLVLQGASTAQIATALLISRYTVQDHLKHIFDKVGVRSRRELVKRLLITSAASLPRP
ncbi:MAG: transcriptional regulator, LuxR family [Symbiobacteriaceae bacterium]|jgi:DNA-binding CsgD family transcriptional regulator|nr:transcriptional regulator, LuxR family [Symbiobacteriaceae bacterium]